MFRSRSESERVGSNKIYEFSETMGKVLNVIRFFYLQLINMVFIYLMIINQWNLRYMKSEDIKIPIFKRGKVLQSSLPKALFLNSRLTTSYGDATRLLPQENNNRSLRRATVRESAGRRFLGNGTIGALSGVKLDVDDTSEMVVMEKDLTQQVYAQGKSNNKKTKRVSKKKRGKRDLRRRSRRSRRSRRQ